MNDAVSRYTGFMYNTASCTAAAAAAAAVVVVVVVVVRGLVD